MNSKAIAGLVFLGCLVLSGFAIAGAEGIKWKFLNLIILAFMAMGLGVGFGLGAWGNNQTIGAEIAMGLMPWLGVVGAFGCLRRNKMRLSKQTGSD
jgi:hypothetical protein